MKLLGTQYYRPPFPGRKYWRDDLARMADAGLNCVQLWVTWAWVERESGRFLFDDYDELVSLADRQGLKVVLSTIAEVQPYWIHREVAESEMIDSQGRRVVSSNRLECHFGLTPGGCLDHPGVTDRMRRFLEATVERYKGAANLAGWDAWNELRWNIQADGLVCYCPCTIKEFRRWLGESHGGLDGLNEAWQRRYTSWEDVLPGKMARGPYTEMMAFQHFLTHRANEHALWRYRIMKTLDPDRPVTVHGGSPSVLVTGMPEATAIHRGNDWVFAETIDGVGTSSFPRCQGMDDAEFATRIDCSASAAGGKRLWLSELQGGRGGAGFDLEAPVPAADQQRWIWIAWSRGAEAVLFWCWRDEIFGRETAGFGLCGRDGHAGERLAALRRTSVVMNEHAELLEGYRADPPQVGVYFSPQTYYLAWIEKASAWLARTAVMGYARALALASIPYVIVEENHLATLAALKVLILPRTLVIDDPAVEAITAFVRRGGLLICESETGAFESNGLYRQPEERFLATLTGVQEIGRRPLARDSVTVTFADERFEVPAMQWATPFSGTAGNVLAHAGDDPLALDVPVGEGRVILLGTYLGEGYFRGSAEKDAKYAPFAEPFGRMLAAFLRSAGVTATARVLESEAAAGPGTMITSGASGDARLTFLFGGAARREKIFFPAGVLGHDPRPIVGDGEIEIGATDGGQRVSVTFGDWGLCVLVGDERAGAVAPAR